MASRAQITANQSNAQHSTGPRTVEGKQHVSQNAVRHGLTARYPVVRDDERDAFAALRDGLTAELDPQSTIENVVFQQILLAAWNLQRFSRIEAEVSSGTAEDFTNPATAAALDRLSVYQARAQRAWSKGIAELRTLQTTRVRKLEVEGAAEVPAIAPINDLTKQTHSEVTAETIDLVEKFLDVESVSLLHHARRESPSRF